MVEFPIKTVKIFNNFLRFYLYDIYMKYIIMLKDIPQSDISVRPFKVYKEWQFTEEDILSYYGTNITGSVFDAETDLYTAKLDGNGNEVGKIYHRTLYNSIKSQYYTNTDTGSILNDIGKRKSYASNWERNIDDNIMVLSLKQDVVGHGIKPLSVELIQNSSIYTDDGYSNLVSGSNVYGNVFYDRGLIVFTKDVVSGSTLSEFDLRYRSTQVIYENEILVSILENEFNVSQNPTAVDWDNDLYGKVKIDTIVSAFDGVTTGGFGDYEKLGRTDDTGSYLAPFITTIGLYDDEYNMVAVAKLPQPIKSLPNYPINFIVRFDT
jgi:hypothetical protein